MAVTRDSGCKIFYFQFPILCIRLPSRCKWLQGLEASLCYCYYNKKMIVGIFGFQQQVQERTIDILSSTKKGQNVLASMFLLDEADPRPDQSSVRSSWIIVIQHLLNVYGMFAG